VLAIQEKALGPGHPDLAGILNNVAIVRWQVRDFEGARPLYERALAMLEAGTVQETRSALAATGLKCPGAYQVVIGTVVEQHLSSTEQRQVLTPVGSHAGYCVQTSLAQAKHSEAQSDSAAEPPAAARKCPLLRFRRVSLFRVSLPSFFSSGVPPGIF
jgi:tetratricopeptide repeat protein